MSNFATVLADYEQRSADDIQRAKTVPFEQMLSFRDEMLLPVGPEAGAFLGHMARGLKAQRILELGTSYGYSTLWLAQAAAETGGKVFTVDIAKHKQDYAREQLKRAGLDAHVEFVTGDALAMIDRLQGPFDLVLLDLWKEAYVPAFDKLAPKLAEGGTIVADNILFPIEVRDVAALYRKRVREAPEFSTVLLPIGQGLEVSRWRN